MKRLTLCVLLALPLTAGDEMAVTIDREGRFLLDGAVVDRHTLDGRIRERAKAGPVENSELALVATCDERATAGAVLDLLCLGGGNGVVHFRVTLGGAEAAIEVPTDEAAWVRELDMEYPGYRAGRDAETVCVHLCCTGDLDRHLEHWHDQDAKGAGGDARAWINESTEAAIDPADTKKIEGLVEAAAREWEALKAQPKPKNTPCFVIRCDANVPAAIFHALVVALQEKGIPTEFTVLPSPLPRTEVKVEVDAKGSYRLDGQDCAPADLRGRMTALLDPTREGWNNTAVLEVAADPMSPSGAVEAVLEVAAASALRGGVLSLGEKKVRFAWQMGRLLDKGPDGKAVEPRKTTLSLCASGDAEDHEAHWPEHRGRLAKVEVSQCSYVWWGKDPGAVVEATPEACAEVARQVDSEDIRGRCGDQPETCYPSGEEDVEPGIEDVDDDRVIVPLIVLLRVDPSVPYRDLFALLEACQAKGVDPEWREWE